MVEFLEAAFDAIIAFDPQERVVYWNPAAEQMFGWTAQEAYGKMPEELFRLRNTAQEKEQARERLLSLNRGAMLRGEHHPCRKDGSAVWVQYTARAIFDTKGRITGYLTLHRDISVQMRLQEKEEQLKQSNQKLNEILASIQDDFYVLDREWNFVYASRLFTSKVGKEPEDFVGNNLWQMFPKHRGTALEENFRAAMEKGEIRSFEIPGQDTNAWYRLKVFPSAEGITVLGTDISERKRAEGVLKKSEERFRIMANDLPFPIWVTNARGEIEMVNRTYEEFFGVKEEQVVPPNSWQPLLHPDEREAYTSAYFKSIQEQAPFSCEARVKRADGKWRWIASQGTPRFGPKGGFLGHVGSSPDITRRRRAEEELRELSQRLTYHVDNSPLAVIEWGPDMRLIRWSGTAERMFGWKAEEVLGKRIEDFRWVYDEDTQQVNNVSVALRSGSDRSFSANRNYRKDGSVAYCEWYNSSLVDEAGNFRSILSLVLDVTERKRAEEALRESQKELQLLNQSLEQKVYEKTTQVRRLASDLVKAEQRERSRISHILHDDLQQRIYALQIELNFFRDALCPEDEAAHKKVSDIESQMGEIRQIIRHLSIELSPPILPEEGLSHALNWLAVHVQQQHGLPIEVEAEGAFALLDEELHVLLFNCVRELLFNVVKHAQASRAVIELQWSDDGLEIEVRDDGKGFTVHKRSGGLHEEDELPSSFGLPTIRHQLSLFGGSMQINSEPGVGTRILLSVPVKQAG